MKPILLLALLILAAPFAARAEFGLPALNEGVSLTYDSTDPDGLPLLFEWAPQEGRSYLVEYSTTLNSGDWHCLPTYFESISHVTGNPWLKLALTDDRYFLRLRFIDSRINVVDFRQTADSDHDGLPDITELNTTHSHPFQNADLSANGLPDDWEAAYPDDPENPSDFAARYAAYRRDWVKGCHLAFGPKLFAFSSLDSENFTIYLYGEFEDGCAKVIFTDDTYSSIASIRIYPRLKSQKNALINETAEILDAEPCATYTAVTDSAHPELSGLIFTGTNAAGHIGRDLLRTYDTSLVPVGSSLPTGATVPMPYRRAVVSLTGGGSEVRRIPAPLAITSLPLTQINPTSFPVVIRDVEQARSHYFDFWNTPFPETLLPGSVKFELDADGLPEAARNPSLPWNSGTKADTLNSPATCRQWFRYPVAVTYSVPGLTEVFQPPGTSSSYRYGYFSNGLSPHKDEVHDNFAFTSEMHMTLDYTPTTRLYFDSDDDSWVFINDKLVSEFDLGGIHEAGNYVSILFSDLKDRLDLTSTTGTCRVDIFHANRYQEAAELRFLSTDPLRPVYVYKVVADSMTNAPITYSFAVDSATGMPKAPAGMEISATTGKVTWNLYGRKNSSGQPIAPPTGACPVTIRVTDDLGHSDEQSFVITVGN